MTTRTLIPFPELLGPGIIGGPPARRSVAALNDGFDRTASKKQARDPRQSNI
jgi:hypothetical protein